MAKDKICGIYCIRNAENTVKYIGQSYDIEKRWKQHKWELNNNRHHNKYLQNAWNKYGEDNFEFFIIETCDKLQLNELEMFWINALNTMGEGYNLTKGGDGCCGKKWTYEEIERVSMPVLQFNLDGKIIKKWPSIECASKQLNINNRQIWKVANKYIRIVQNGEYAYAAFCKTAGGYIWCYERNFNDFDINDYKDMRKKTAVRQYDLNWNLIKTWPSSEKTANDGYEPTTILDACKGKWKTAYGCIWIFDNIENLDEYIIWYKDHFNIQYVGQYDLNNNLINVFNDAVSTRQYGFNPCLVRECLRGKQCRHKGYIFKYIPWKELKLTNWKGKLNYGKYE